MTLAIPAHAQTTGSASQTAADIASSTAAAARAAYNAQASSTQKFLDDINAQNAASAAQQENPDVTELLKQQAADAQKLTDIPSQYKEFPLSVTMTPDNPVPNQSVTVDIESFSTDLNKDTIVWTLNGKEMNRGIGEKELIFNTGNIGTQSRVVITITDQDGNTTQKVITINPGEVDLLWQADTYTPPFYEGKALFTNQSKITVVAMPNLMTSYGTRLSAKNLVYKWKKDGTVMDSQSGYGKNTVSFEETVPTESTPIEVDVTSLDGTIKAHGQLNIESISPEIVLYQNDPLLGILYQQALQSPFSLNNKEATLVAIPYFFSTTNRDALNYVWQVNSTDVTGSNKSSLVLRNSNNQTGTASVTVEATDPKKVFQTVDSDLFINFGTNLTATTF